MSKYQNKYRIESARLNVWDYANPWWYYVTINTKDHEEWFGKIVNGEMKINELGKVVEEEWLKTKLVRTNVELDYYVVMPNHFHGIIILNENIPNVETRHGESLQNKTDKQFGRPIKNSLSVIINQFKGSVKRWANKNDFNSFSWQSRFYDRIIRNEKELFNIRKYIEDNPLRWEFEMNQPENLNI